MTPLPAPFLDHIAHWPDSAQLRLCAMRTLFHDVADHAGTGPFGESLKWGQPAWRPKRPRTGATLRLNWSNATPDSLVAHVDCKTDLAARFRTRFRDVPCDGRRAIWFSLADAQDDALWHLAHMTFTYHRTKQGSAD